MNLHPQIATALVVQRERELLRRAEEHRRLSRRERPIRNALWLRTSS